MLEEDIAVFVGTTHSGMFGVQRMVAERLNGIPIHHFSQILVIPHVDLLDFVRRTETVEEVDERHFAFNRGQVRNSSQVHNFLRVGFSQHGKTGLTAGIHVGVIAENVQRVASYAASGNMEHAGQQFAGDFIHVGDHQQQALRAVKVVVRAPAAREPCTAPAAPASDCISITCTVLPKMFFWPAADHWST